MKTFDLVDIVTPGFQEVFGDNMVPHPFRFHAKMIGQLFLQYTRRQVWGRFISTHVSCYEK